MHSADLQIDGLRRLVVLTPRLAEYEGEEHRKHDAELQEDNGTDVVMKTAQVDLNTAVANAATMPAINTVETAAA